MPLSVQHDTTFTGPALPEPFVRLQLEAELSRLGLLPRVTGEEGRTLVEFWRIYRAHLRLLVSQGGSLRVRNQAVEPLLGFAPFGYTAVEDAPEVTTREGHESGGCFLADANGRRLRCWTSPLEEDLDAPARRGEAYRFSHARIASRVLLATGERLGLLTNGIELRLLICDPARLDTTIAISLDSSWKRQREVPDSFRLFLALACPGGVAALPDLLEKARLQQQKVTKDLRVQARLGVRDFLQAILDHPENRTALGELPEKDTLARTLWREGLVTVYRLLFILKVESTDDPAKALGFASGSLWRNTFSPTIALSPLVRATLDRGDATGTMLEDGLRNLFRIFSEGIDCTEMTVRPMGGGLFDPTVTPLLSRLRWGEVAVAQLLNHILWTEPRRGATARERVHYGPLDVEDLGRVYEALLELEPGIATESVCRLRRAKLEVVVPLAQGDRYRPAEQTVGADGEIDEEDQDAAEEESAGKRGGTKVEWIEEIRPGSYFLRVGLGRKASGSFYTPESFVRFLVQETLGPLVDRVSPRDDPQPAAILKLKVIDKAMGSGHFLVGADRFLGDRLYEACRRCDELASQAEWKLEHQDPKGADLEATQRQLEIYRARLGVLPDPDQEVVRYLPSRVLEGVENGYSQRKAVALCRRLIAVHCLYGVDRNPLAVELAKLSLWIECHAEGLPLTFLDHRLVLGDSLTGALFTNLLNYPVSGEPLDDLFTRGLRDKLTVALGNALSHVRELEASAGITLAEVEAKRTAKLRLERALAPFKVIAAAWSGGVMLGSEYASDTDYLNLVRTVAETGHLPRVLQPGALLQMISKGLGNSVRTETALVADDLVVALAESCSALPFDLVFPEVFYPSGNPANCIGFDSDVGNPPWEGIDTSNKEFFAAFDFSILELRTDGEIKALIQRLMSDPVIESLRNGYEREIDGLKRAIKTLLKQVNRNSTGGSAATPDLYQCFVERGYHILKTGGNLGMVLPSAVHANEGAAGIRSVLVEQMRLRECFSFENKRRLFEIHASMKFAAVVADKAAQNGAKFRCAFYLLDDEWLFAADRQPPELEYDQRFLRIATGAALNFPELRRPEDVPPFLACYEHKATTFGSLRRILGVTPTEELHKSKQRWRFVLTSSILPNGDDPRDPWVCQALRTSGYLPLIEGSTFHQFTDHWDVRPEYVVPLDRMTDKRERLESARTYRVAFRWVASSTNERTAIFHLLPPGGVFANNALVESNALRRRSCDALLVCALADSFPFDWLLRQFVAANVQFNFLDPLPVPSLDEIKRFLSHSALRLTCNHAGYEPLWREQLGTEWREPKVHESWPVLEGNEQRWDVRASVDAVVAQAYGLSRSQYSHVLGTFSHSSYPAAKDLCLARFDELHRDGLEAFIRCRDPYHDVPLNDALPRPVIELPLPTAPTAVGEGAQDEFALEGSLVAAPRRRGRRR